MKRFLTLLRFSFNSPKPNVSPALKSVAGSLWTENSSQASSVVFARGYTRPLDNGDSILSVPSWPCWSGFSLLYHLSVFLK